MNNQSQAIHDEIIAILEQGTSAVKAVIDAYLEQRTPERDMNWLCIQMGKEFGAIMLHTDRAKAAIRAGTDGRAMDEYVETIKEEVEHYQAYHRLLDRTIGEAGEIPVADIYRYVFVNADQGAMEPDPVMVECSGKWPENFAYLTGFMPWVKTQHPWVGRVVGATLEGAAGGWHWCMSQLPPNDDFLQQAAKLQRGIAIDELHHGPQELAELCAEYDPAWEIDLAEMYRKLREMRCQELRQRNEQFLHPLSDQRIETIAGQLLDGTMPRIGVYSEAA